MSTQFDAGDRPELSLVIPVFNGAETIGRLVEALSTCDIVGGFEIVLVNDGSADNSAAVCAGIVDTAPMPVTFLDLTKNFGEHNAVLAGLRQARGHYVITMDDDLQNSPDEVPKLYRFTRDNGFDVVYTRFPKKQHSLFRNLGSRLANLTADVVLHKPKGLYLSSFRCMSRIVVDQVVGYSGPYPYVDGLIFQATDRVGSLEVEHLPRVANKSNYTFRRLLKLWTIILLNFSTLPLRASIWLGMIMALVAVAGIIYVLIDYFTAGKVAPGWASLMIVILVFSALQFVFIGLVGEYLGRLCISFGGRPQSVVRDIRSNTATDSTAPDAAPVHRIENAQR